MSEFAKLATIGGGLIMNIVYIIGGIVLCAVLFFITRWVQKTTKRQKSFTITADIVDMNGVLEFDKLAFVKSEQTGLLEMNFQTRKSDSIPPIPKDLIRNHHVLLLNYAPGHYCVVDTAKTIANYEKGINKVEVYNLGMKKYITAKTREILNKAQEKQRKIEVWGPWITLGVAVIGAIILAAFLFWFGLEREAANIAERTQQCINMGWRS
jgi:ABC-type transport system involved in cytochrome bd biosynthesis fused ATPase/permease subunit